MRLHDVLGSGRDQAQADVAPVTEPAEPTTPGAPKPRGPLRRLLVRRAPGSRTSAPGDRVQWDHGDRIATRLLHVVLLGALVSGPAAACGWRGGGGHLRIDGPVGGPSSTAGTDATLAEATAQRLVLTWLTASAKDKAAVQALIAAPLPATLELPEQRPAAPTQMWVGEVVGHTPGRFQVTVATSGGAAGPAAYFTVPVRVGGGVSVALALPARTRPPAVADADRFRLPALTTVATDDPAFQTAAGYVTAYLTGSPELDRWTGPNARLTPVLPRACGSVRVDTVQEMVTADEASTIRADVIATATCLAGGRSSTTSQYGLVLQVRDGRWEVAAEDPALLLDPTSTTTLCPAGRRTVHPDSNPPLNPFRRTHVRSTPHSHRATDCRCDAAADHRRVAQHAAGPGQDRAGDLRQRRHSRVDRGGG